MLMPHPCHNPFRTLTSSFGMAVIMVACLGVASANAQYSHDPIQNRDIAHAQQMNSYAYSASMNSAGSQYYEEDYDSGYYTRSAPAPLTLEELYLAEAQERDAEIMAEEEAERRYDRYVNGGWSYNQAHQPSEPGEYCAATYLNRDGIITIQGLDRSSDGALLMFIGRKIPEPHALERVTATLSQTGAPPATVGAYLFEEKRATRGFGTIVFYVPSMEDALRTMLEENDFVVRVEGEEIFRMGYKNGLRAREELRKCVNQR